MSEYMSPIPSRLYNAAVGGHVAGADQIIDDETGLTLDKIAGGALEEKEYTSGSDNGMGRVVLRKNLVEGVNTLTQSMINKSNTIYVIQYDFTLGENITVPADCVLEFDGGSISGDGTNKDTITGTNTKINNKQELILKDLILSGTWNQDIVYDDWFDCDDDLLFANISTLATGNICTNVIFSSANTYNVNATKTGGSYPTAFQVPSNVKVQLDCNINLIGNALNEYSIIGINKKANIHIFGIGTLTADAATHDYTEYPNTEYGHCIYIEGSDNVTVEGITCQEATGDGVCIDADIATAEISSNIYILKSKCTKNRRQGITVGSVDNVFIDDCIISYTGHASGASAGHDPRSAVDVEPWRKDGNNTIIPAKNVFITNCVVTEQEKGVHIDGATENVIIDNVLSEGDIQAVDDAKNVFISNCKCSDIYCRNDVYMSYVSNCVTGCVVINNGSKVRYSNITVDDTIPSFYRNYASQGYGLIRLFRNAATPQNDVYDVEFDSCTFESTTIPLYNATMQLASDSCNLVIRKSRLALTYFTDYLFDIIESDIELSDRAALASGYLTKHLTIEDNTIRQKKASTAVAILMNLTGSGNYIDVINNIMFSPTAAAINLSGSSLKLLYIYNNVFCALRDANNLIAETLYNALGDNVTILNIETRKTPWNLSATYNLGGWDRGSCSFYNGKPIWWNGSDWVDATGQTV